jgi:putative tricarboxylic transport membrane protein
MKFRRDLTRLAAAAAFAVLAATSAGAADMESLYVMAPANPGGGWDQTARSIQEAMQTAGIAGSVQVENVGGAGGTVGLAQFVDRKKGDGSALLVSGLVMVGAILTNQSPVTLDQVTPIARLTGEYEVIVVPGSSDIQSLDQLVEKLKADPGSVSWGGGSAGGTDHILVGLIAKAVGADPTGINYIPYSGGGEALAAIMGGHVTAGVSGYGEFAGQIASGDLKALAISAPERIPGIDVPTLKEQGVDVELANWRAVMAPPGIDDAQRAALVDAVGKMVESEPWQTTLKQKDWMNLYLAGDDFAAYLAKQNEDITVVLHDIGLVQ